MKAEDRLVFLTDGILERNAADLNALEILTPRCRLADSNVACSRTLAQPSVVKLRLEPARRGRRGRGCVALIAPARSAFYAVAVAAASCRRVASS